MNRTRKSIVETFSRAYEAVSPEEQAELRVWMRNVILPQKKPRKNLKLSRRCEKDIIAACDRRILEFPLSMSPNAVAKTLKAEGWYGPKTTVYYIEYRFRRLRRRGHTEDVPAK